MDVFDLDGKLLEDYKRFARSFTQIRSEDIREGVNRIYQKNHFWPAPLISINPHFEKGKSVSELVADKERTLHPHTEQIFRIYGTPITLHRHQGEAISNLHPAISHAMFHVATPEDHQSRLEFRFVGDECHIASIW